MHLSKNFKLGSVDAHGFATPCCLAGMLSRLYSNGKSLRDVILDISCEIPVGAELPTRLISPGDPVEYAEATMMRSFAAVTHPAPPIQSGLRLEQQSTQAEVSNCEPWLQRCQLGKCFSASQLVLRAIEALICSKDDANVLSFGFRKVQGETVFGF